MEIIHIINLRLDIYMPTSVKYINQYFNLYNNLKIVAVRSHR